MKKKSKSLRKRMWEIVEVAQEGDIPSRVFDIAILGIGMFALPTGILGAGFVEEINRSREEPTVCPHCGKKIS